MHFAVRPRGRLFGVLSAAVLGMSSFSAAAVPVATNVVMHPMVSDYQFISATTPTEAQCASVGRRCFTPQSTQAAYNVDPLYAAGMDGRGHHDRDRRLLRQRHDGPRPARLRPGVRPASRCAARRA